MASRKELKKDINFLTGEIIDTCLMHYYLKQGDEQARKTIDALMEEAVSLRNDLIYKINHPGEELKGSELKGYYSELMKEMVEKTDQVFEKLSAFTE